jgi:hypothetical protein
LTGSAGGLTLLFRQRAKQISRPDSPVEQADKKYKKYTLKEEGHCA